MSTQENLQPFETSTQVAPVQHRPAYLEHTVAPAGYLSDTEHGWMESEISAEIADRYSKMSAYREQGGKDWSRSPEMVALSARNSALVESLLSSQEDIGIQKPTPKQVEKAAVADKVAQDEKTRNQLEEAKLNGDVHDLTPVDTSTFLTLQRAMEMYGERVTGFFGIDDLLPRSLALLKAVQNARIYNSEGNQAYLNMTPEQLEAHNETHAKLLQKLSQQEGIVIDVGGSQTQDAHGSAVTYRQGYIETVDNEVRSDYVDGMTLMLGLWSLSSMNLLAPDEGEQKAAEEAIKVLQGVAESQKSPIVVEPELQNSEFIDILPANLGKLAVAGPLH